MTAVKNKRKTWDNFTSEDWIRGESLPDVEQKCLQLCAEYIGGAWSFATDPAKDLVVRRMTGGLTNQLYHVVLADHVTTPIQNNIYYDDEPREVVIKFYQTKHYRPVERDSERLPDTIISLLASQLEIGPKVYGIFDNGIIQAYYKHIPFRVEQKQNDRLLRLAMHKLAAIHLLKVPITKQANWPQDYIEKQIKLAYSELNISHKLIKYELKTLRQYDPLEEIVKYRAIVDSVVSPLVFCHDDFRSSNIMVVGDQPEKQRIILSDFEYVCYGMRGFDLGCILVEWHNDDYTTQFWQTWQVPSQHQLERVVRFYLEGCDAVCPGYSTQSANSFDQVIRDTKIAILQNLMFIFAFRLNLRKSFVKGIEFDLRKNLERAELVYKTYHKMKQHLITVGIISED